MLLISRPDRCPTDISLFYGANMQFSGGWGVDLLEVQLESLPLDFNCIFFSRVGRCPTERTSLIFCFMKGMDLLVSEFLCLIYIDHGFLAPCLLLTCCSSLQKKKMIWHLKMRKELRRCQLGNYFICFYLFNTILVLEVFVKGSWI